MSTPYCIFLEIFKIPLGPFSALMNYTLNGGRKKKKGWVGAYLYYLTRTWKYGEAQDTNVCLEKYDFVMSNIVILCFLREYMEDGIYDMKM
jgi:hypothetical protein